MATPVLPRAWFVAFAELLERIHAERPELIPTGIGNRPSVLSVAVKMVAESQKISINGARSRWLTMRTDHPDLVPPFMHESEEFRAGEVPAAPVRTLDEDIALGRAKQTAADAERRFRDAKARIVELEDWKARHEALAAQNPKPATWTLKARPGKKSEHMPYLLTSDHQVGEVIRASETDAGTGYDTETYKRRYRALIGSAIYLCDDHAAGWRFPGFIYARGGDTISGGIHDELRETDDLTPIEAVRVAFETEAWGIHALADHFGMVDVKDVGGGNHDRDTRKPQSKRFGAHSFDSLVGYWLRREFVNDKRVTFQGTESPDVRFPIYGRTVLLTHGDKIGSRGGQGFVGPSATILRGAQKIMMEQQALGYSVDEIHMGHFHTFVDAGWAVCNGCLPGFSEFAKQFRMRPEPPMQLLMFYHPEHGRVDTKRIFLDAARKPGT